jgi:hypothetical protein
LIVIAALGCGGGGGGDDTDPEGGPDECEAICDGTCPGSMACEADLGSGLLACQ